MTRCAKRLALAAALLISPALAQAEPVHGRLQLQDVYAQEDSRSLAAALGVRRRNDVLGDLRLSWTPRRQSWTFDFAYVAAVDAGDTPRYQTREAALNVLPPAPPATWWDLSDSFIDQSRLKASHRIDRLAIGYTGAHIVVRAGRQALTWGAGLIFHPMDLFDPFAPDATDTEYKTGTDMLYGQYLFNDGSDLQAIIVPRPQHRGGGLTANASSFALHYHAAVGNYQTTWLVARDHGDMVAGIGINGSLAGATWNAEVIPTFVDHGDTYVSALLNISNAGKLWARDVTYFAEYYRNGFGLDSSHYTLTGLPAVLIDRLQRGQVFNTGRDYLALGAQLQWTPLLQLSPTLIANLNDESLYALAEASYSLSDNLTLNVGTQLPIGPHNTEFGGVALSAGGAPYLESPARLYAQVRYYF
jgi:hypothetical protein